MKIKPKDIIAELIIVALILFFTYLSIFGNPFFRDFGIVFEGGYRISIGQLPFIDFSIPPMPLIFFLQALFNLIFGARLISSLLFSACLSSIITIYFYDTIKDRFNSFFNILMSVAFFYSFIGMIGFPWYNQLAFFFFLFNVLYLFRDRNNDNSRIFWISSILAILSFLSKTDLGLIHFFSILIFFIVTSKKYKKILLLYIIPFLIGAIFFTELFSYISYLNNIQYGSGALIARFVSMFRDVFTYDKFLYSFNFYLLLFLSFLFIRDISNNKKSIPFVLLIILNLFIFGALLTSGISIQTGILALPLNLFLIYYIIFEEKLNESSLRFDKRNLKLVALFLIFLIILTQFNDLSKYESVFFTSPTKQAYINFFTEKTGYEKIDFGCYKGEPMKKDNAESLKKIRSLIEKNNRSFISFTEYTFLYCDYNKTPPKDIPLWLQEDLTFSKQDLPRIENAVTKEKPSLVLERLYASQDIIDSFHDFLYKNNYSNILNVTSDIDEIRVFQK